MVRVTVVFVVMFILLAHQFVVVIAQRVLEAFGPNMDPNSISDCGEYRKQDDDGDEEDELLVVQWTVSFVGLGLSGYSLTVIPRVLMVTKG